MRQIFYSLWVAAVVISLFTSCSKNPDVSDIQVDLTINRYEQTFFKAKTKEELTKLLDQDPSFANHYLKRSQYPQDSLLVNQLYRLVNDKYMDTLYNDTQNHFADISDLQAQLTSAFKHIKYYYPDFQIPKVYTFVSGLSFDVFVSDSVIVIGLDYFLGDGARYRPNEVPNYMLKRLKRDYIVPSIVTLISQKYAQSDILDKTMLAEMMYYGKAYYFAHKMLPETSDSLIIGYSTKELADSDKNKAVIWGHFVENNLFFETTNFIKSKYVGERPQTFEIGNACPGRIGRWLGYEIIKKYEEESGKNLPAIMAEKNAKVIFEGSKFKPE